MNEITVDPQEVVVWLAFSDGWKKASGFVVTIQGVKFSFVPYNNACPKLLISELSSGSKCVEIDFSIIDFINSSTKEGTIQVFSEYATKFSECIDSNLRKQIITQSARQKKEHESKFGKIPEVVPFDLEGWAEDARAGDVYDEPPYSPEDYADAKAQGLDLDDWNDYQRYCRMGAWEDWEEAE